VPIPHVTPELDPSFATASVKICDPPLPRLMVAGLIGLRLIAVSGIVTVADLVVSVLLVAVTLAEGATIITGAVYTPAAVMAPVEAVHVTPWFSAVSPVTVAVNACVAPPIIGAGVVGPTPTAIGVNVIVAVADLVVSVLLVAVTVAVAVVAGAGAVYTPAGVMEPTDALHVTPALAESLVTDATKVCAAPATSVPVVEFRLTAIGVKVTVAVADLLASALLVAVTVADVKVMTVGAVYTPAEVTVPVDAVQVTPELAESFATVAVNVWVAPPIRVTTAGPTVTPIAGAVGVEEPLPQPAKRATAAKLVNTHGNQRTFGMARPYLRKKGSRQKPWLDSFPKKLWPGSFVDEAKSKEQRSSMQYIV
jgi:hypothetical protein